MRRKQILSMLFFAATAMALNAAPIAAQSIGGTRSERAGGDSDTPAPPQSQPGDSGKARIGSGNKAQSGAAQRNKDTSVGGTQSERAGDSDTPLPPQGTPGDASKNRNRAASGSTSGTAQGNKDTSVGGSQSERSGGDSQTPLPKGSRSAGTSESSGSLQRRTEAGNMNGQQEVRLAQEALKNQGHDPGPIDGIMGSQTRQALREFQSTNGLKQTGRLDSQTKQKLNIEGSSSTAPMGR
jgi:hypothetical protein